MLQRGLLNLRDPGLWIRQDPIWTRIHRARTASSLAALWPWNLLQLPLVKVPLLLQDWRKCGDGCCLLMFGQGRGKIFSTLELFRCFMNMDRTLATIRQPDETMPAWLWPRCCSAFPITLPSLPKLRRPGKDHQTNSTVVSPSSLRPHFFYIFLAQCVIQTSQTHGNTTSFLLCNVDLRFAHSDRSARLRQLEL